MIEKEERERMLQAHSIGPKMVDYLERSGVTTLNELRERTAESVLLQIEVETGVRLNSMGRDALANLIEMAKVQS